MSKVIQGDNKDVLPGFADNQFTAIVTDIPYGIKTHNQSWDSGLPPVDTMQECHRVVRPGGLFMTFSDAKRLPDVVSLMREAGWLLLDIKYWVYGTANAIPQSIGKMIEKRAKKTGDRELHAMAIKFLNHRNRLRSVIEPIPIFMKPTQDTFIDNALAWGVAGINHGANGKLKNNLMVTESAVDTLGSAGPDALRLYFAGKPSVEERNAGLHSLEDIDPTDDRSDKGKGLYNVLGIAKQKNGVEAVKPLEVMLSLVDLATMPFETKILDPWAGSGTTCLACKMRDIDFTAIELRDWACKVIEHRLNVY